MTGVAWRIVRRPVSVGEGAVRMRMLLNTLLLGGCLALVAGGAAWAGGLPTIDDFTTGPTSIVFNGATQTGTLSKTTYEEGSTILGGVRSTYMTLDLTGNPYGQNAQLRVKGKTALAPAALVVSQGFQSDVLVEIEYGSDLGSNGKALNANFTPYDRFRVHFLGVSSGLNFGIEASTGTGLTLWACNFSQAATAFTADFPLANGASANGGANLASVGGLLFQFQGAGVLGNDFGVSLIEMVTPGTPPADTTCGPATVAG